MCILTWVEIEVGDNFNAIRKIAEHDFTRRIASSADDTPQIKVVAHKSISILSFKFPSQPGDYNEKKSEQTS